MSRDIKLLHPEVQAIIPKFLEECKKQGLIVKITETLRTKKSKMIYTNKVELNQVIL